MKSIIIVFLFVITVVSIGGKALSAPLPLDGAIIVRVPDGTDSTCINLNKHQISIHLRRLLIQKDSGWFKEDKEAGLILKSTVNSRNIKTESRDKVTYPQMFQAPIAEYSAGVISIPVEQRLFHRFKLKDSVNEYDSIDLSFIVLKKEKAGKFGVALNHLASITKKINLPANPLVDTFKLFAEYADNVVTDSIDKNNNVDEALKEGNLVFSFSDNDACKMDEEFTGTIAVVKEISGLESDGIVDISKQSQYCWDANFKPTFTLKFAKKISSSCNNVEYKQVNNPYYAFVLNAEEYNGNKSKPKGFNVESYERCDKNGIPAERCM